MNETEPPEGTHESAVGDFVSSMRQRATARVPAPGFKGLPASQDIETAAEVPTHSWMGRYAQIETVGSGGMGTVVRAYDTWLRREVALKFVRTRSRESQRRALREARAMAQVSHANVVSVFDAVKTAEGLAIVMQLVAGRTLLQHVRTHKCDAAAVLSLFCEAARGLAAAHARGLVHRDFKPANVLVSELGEVLVTDFGLCRATSAETDVGEGDSHDSSDALGGPVTTDGFIVGTARYMAPEQAEGQPADALADQYAFCVALWEVLAGAPPFEQVGSAALLRAKRGGPPAFVTKRAVPRGVARALRRGLGVDPHTRFPSMEALIRALDVRGRRRRRTSVGGLVVAGAVGLVGAAALDAPDAACQGASATMSGTWSDGRRASVAAGLSTVDLPYARGSAERIAAQLDAYAVSWIAEANEVCQARRDSTTDAPTAAVRQRCLAGARVELDRTAGLFEGATHQILDDAGELVAALPRVGDCGRAVPIGDQPSLLGRIIEADVQDRLAASRVALRASDTPGAVAQLLLVEDTLAGIHRGAMHVELALQRAQLALAQGALQEAEERFRSALGLATTVGDWVRTLEALSGLVETIGVRLRRGDEAIAYLRVAETFAEAHGTARTRGALALAAGGTYRVLARYREAERALRSAVRIYEEEYGPRSIPVGRALVRLADAQSEAQELDDAAQSLRRALTVFDTALDAQHPAWAHAQSSLGVVHARAGQPKPARRSFERALASFEQSLPPEHPSRIAAQANLANILLDEGDAVGAIPLLRRVIEAYDVGQGPRSMAAGRTQVSLGKALVQSGAQTEGLAVLTVAVEVLREVAPSHPMTSWAEQEAAEALLGAGRKRDAEALARSAWARIEHAELPDGLKADAAWILARTTHVPAEAETLAAVAAANFEAAGDAERADGARAFGRQAGVP